MKKPSMQKTVVLGLDGAPYTLIRRLVSQGRLPHISKLLGEGTLARMTTSLPDISSVAWASFMTGKNPGKHNIFGFTDRCDDSYDIYFPNSGDVRAATLWEYLSHQDKRAVVINVPTTYPAQSTAGVLISGFVAIDLERAVYPKSLIPFLKEMGYRIDVDFQKAHTDPDGFFEDLFDTHERRTRAMLHLMENEPWEFFMGVFTGPDRLQHFFWEHMESGDIRHGERFLRYYEQVDAAIGQILARMDPDTHLILMSDHGFCLLKKEVYINYYLKERGYLRFRKETPETLADIDTASRAYCLDPGRIYINLKGRQPQGCVEPGEPYEKLREELAREFSDLRDESTGERMIEKVWRREDLYSGPFYHRAPDLILQSRYGYDLKGAMSRESLTGRGTFTGMHTYDDAMFYIRGHELQGQPAQGVKIFDILPTVLKLMGLEAVPDLDGKALV